MAITDDIRKTLTDATPLYAVAGAADLAAEKLQAAPALLERLRLQGPRRLAAVRDESLAVSQRVTERAQEAQSAVQARMAEVLDVLDPDVRKLRQTAQGLALNGVGRAAEYAIRARETYGDLADRGRGAVRSWRGEAAEEAQAAAEVIEPDQEVFRPAAGNRGWSEPDDRAHGTGRATAGEVDADRTDPGTRLFPDAWEPTTPGADGSAADRSAVAAEDSTPAADGEAEPSSNRAPSRPTAEATSAKRDRLERLAAEEAAAAEQKAAASEPRPSDDAKADPPHDT